MSLPAQYESFSMSKKARKLFLSLHDCNNIMSEKSEHSRCQHASGPVILQKGYVRSGHGFKPCGWVCPDCHQHKSD
jgi:hypothetical protein